MIPTPGKTAILAAILAGPVGLAVAAAPFPRLTVPEMVLPGDDLSLTETRCDLRGVVDRSLRHDFAEEPRLAALTAAGMAMELWTSDSLGTWTLVHHGSDGVTCIVATGMDWTPESEAVVLKDRALAQTVHPS